MVKINGQIDFSSSFYLEKYNQRIGNKVSDLSREARYVILESDQENLADLHSENPTVNKLNYWRGKANLHFAILMAV